MSEGPPHQYPPPGAPPPPEPPPSWPAAPGPGGPPPGRPAYAGPGAPYRGAAGPGAALPPGMLGAAHKPGAIPLRPLTLGSIYDGAFRIIRFNPRATVGSAVLVTAAAMLLPVAATAVLTFTIGVASDTTGDVDPDATDGELVGLLGAYGSLLLGVVLSWIGLVFVTGMIAHVAHAAAVGRRLTLVQAWEATRGKRWKLLGLTLVVTGGWLLLTAVYVAVFVVVAVSAAWQVVLLWSVVTVPAYLCLMFWYWIRVYYLPAPALMLEPIGVFRAIGRGYELTARQFWRTFGIALLTYLVGTIAGQVIATPLSFVGAGISIAWPEYAALSLIVVQAVATIVQSAFVAPFSGAVTSLQYLDQRMRKEAYDVELMREAGLIPR